MESLILLTDTSSYWKKNKCTKEECEKHTKRLVSVFIPKIVKEADRVVYKTLDVFGDGKGWMTRAYYPSNLYHKEHKNTESNTQQTSENQLLEHLNSLSDFQIEELQNELERYSALGACSCSPHIMGFMVKFGIIGNKQKAKETLKDIDNIFS